MAIDSAEKRRSISGIWIPLMPGVTPNAAKDAEWRQQAGWSYSGIAASGEAPVVALAIRYRDFDRRFMNPIGSDYLHKFWGLTWRALFGGATI